MTLLDETMAARRAEYGIAGCAPPGFDPPPPPDPDRIVMMRALFVSLVGALDVPAIQRDLERRIAIAARPPTTCAKGRST